MSGIPTTAAGYGRVDMRHPVAEDDEDVGPRPVFAGEVRGDGTVEAMGVVGVWDAGRRRGRTEWFDEVRLERAVALAEVEGKRVGGKCLRCRVKGMPCSVERARSWARKECEGCRRNGCRWCLRVVDDKTRGSAEDDDGGERWKYVRVWKKRGWRKVDVLVYVREEGEVDMEEVKAYAEELIDGEETSLWGTTLDANDRGALMLPAWKKGYEKTLKRKKELDKEFVDRWRGYKEIQEEEEKRDSSAKDYFALLAAEWASNHPYMPRETQRRRLLADAEIEKHIEQWYWILVNDPDPRMSREDSEWLENMVKYVQRDEDWIALQADTRKCK